MRVFGRRVAGTGLDGPQARSVGVATGATELPLGTVGGQVLASVAPRFAVAGWVRAVVVSCLGWRGGRGHAGVLGLELADRVHAGGGCWRGGRGRAHEAAVAAGEEVFDQFVGGKLVRHARPVGREVAAVDVLQLGELAGLGADGGDVFAFGGAGFGGDDAGDAAEDRGLFERRGDEVGVALGLFHLDADLERAVDLAVLHQVAADDAAGVEVVGVDVGVVVAVSLGVVEVGGVDVLGEVELDVAEQDAAFGAFVILLCHFEVDLVFL